MFNDFLYLSVKDRSQNNNIWTLESCSSSLAARTESNTASKDGGALIKGKLKQAKSSAYLRIIIFTGPDQTCMRVADGKLKVEKRKLKVDYRKFNLILLGNRTTHSERWADQSCLLNSPLSSAHVRQSRIGYLDRLGAYGSFELDHGATAAAVAG